MFKKRHSAMDIANAVAHAVDEMHRTGKAPKAAAPAEGSPAEEAAETPAQEATEKETPAFEAKEAKAPKPKKTAPFAKAKK